jgi:hypothetical protein
MYACRSFGVPQLGYAAWLHVLELIPAWPPSLRHVLPTAFADHPLDLYFRFESSDWASMRPTVHDYGFSVVSPQTEEAHLVE